MKELDHKTIQAGILAYKAEQELHEISHAVLNSGDMTDELSIEESKLQDALTHFKACYSEFERLINQYKQEKHLNDDAAEQIYKHAKQIADASNAAQQEEIFHLEIKEAVEFIQSDSASDTTGESSDHELDEVPPGPNDRTSQMKLSVAELRRRYEKPTATQKPYEARLLRGEKVTNAVNTIESRLYLRELKHRETPPPDHPSMKK